MNGFGIILGSRHRVRQPNAFATLSTNVEHLPATVRPPAGPDRRARDIADNYYPTPPEATRALLSVETFDGPVHEPACGEGHIAEELKAAGHCVVATDLNDRGYGTTGLDFLSQQVPLARHIITNPPYGSGLADAFVRKALLLTRQTGGKVAMLLNLASLAEPARTPLWRRHPPARLYAIDSVVCWPEPVRRPPAHFTRQRYCWAVWTPDHPGDGASSTRRPTFWWLSAAEHRTPQSDLPKEVPMS
jgi:hypothetical protein